MITNLTKKFLTSVALLTFVESVVSSASKTGLDTVFLNFSALENSAFCQYLGSLLGNSIKYQLSRHRHLHVDLSMFI